MTHTLLIVNADDFGIAAGVNQAVAKAFDAGILRSATIMAGGAHFDEAVCIAKDRPALGVGVHMTLTQLAPVAPIDDVPNLAPGGIFAPTHVSFARRLLSGKIPRREIEIEFSAQIERVLAAGIDITHLDSNGHLHVLPRVRAAFAAVAKKFGVAKMRVPMLGGPSRSAEEYVKAIAIAATARAARPAFRGLAHPDHLWGLAASGDMNRTRVLAIIERLVPGTHELMTHPADHDPDFTRAFPWGYHGEAELAALCDLEVNAMVERRGVVLGNYRDI
ncbi:ChbG/HpnK family deacetylase [bacterium]|nr:ChbG/HpnK family deacetylase [bacterium]